MTSAADVVARDGETPLEDVMVAMDVVDTVRHRQILVDRELDADARRERLRERLRDIYTAQGIEVTDEALDAGIAALEEERFSYRPAEAGFSRWLAERYVTRGRWGKRAVIVSAFFAVAFLAWFFDAYLPQQRLRAEIPEAVQTTFATILAEAETPRVQELAADINSDALAAIRQEDFATAEVMHGRLERLLDRVRETYEIRIVSRPDELSGVWRVPDVNESAKNYYLIVEAIAPSGQAVRVPITSEETGRESLVTRWGVRVSEETFASVAADKRDDGIVQDNVIGEKTRGRIEPEYSLPTLDGYITAW